MKPGDVVVSLDDKAIRGSAELRNRVGLMPPGQEVRLGIVRKGRRLEVKAMLGGPDESRADWGEGESRMAGARLREFPPDHPLHGQIKEVLVWQVDPWSKAARAGLRAGDIIVSANQQAVASVDQLAAIARDNGDTPLLLNMQRGDGALFLAIR